MTIFKYNDTQFRSCRWTLWVRSDSFNTSLRQPSFSTELQHKKSGKNVHTVYSTCNICTNVFTSSARCVWPFEYSQRGDSGRVLEGKRPEESLRRCNSRSGRRAHIHKTADVFRERCDCCVKIVMHDGFLVALMLLDELSPRKLSQQMVWVECFFYYMYFSL